MSDAKTDRARADRAASAAVDAAIAAVGGAAPDQAGPPVQLETTPPIIIASTGRPFQLTLPVDLTEPELLSIIGWMATALRSHYRARAQAPASRLVIPR